jgi:LysM repeat protein
MSVNQGPEVFQYTIQPEDTLWELAEEFDTTIEDIIAVNPGIDPDNLFIGQVINISGDAVTAQQYRRRRRFRRPYYRPYRYPYYPYRPYYPYYPYYR